MTFLISLLYYDNNFFSYYVVEPRMSDNYEFEKSSRPQDIDDYSPYTDKQYNGFINDLNSGVYTNTSLSLVQFDLGQIYNSQKIHLYWRPIFSSSHNYGRCL